MTATHDREAQLDFIERHPTRPLDRQSCSWALGLGAKHDHLLDLADDVGRRLVACLFSGMDNPHDVAELLLLGHRSASDDARVFGQAAAWAEERARGAGAAGIEVSSPAALVELATVLEARGYELAYRLHHMILEAIADSPWRELQPPDRAHWVDLGESNAASAYDCYQRAFATTSGAQIPSEEVFRELYLTAERLPRVLVFEGRVVAYLRVTWSLPERLLGEVRTVARDPACPLAGLGKAAMAEALRELGRLGARDAFLEVASDNERAFGLYQKLGFRVVETAAVLRLEFQR